MKMCNDAGHVGMYNQSPCNPKYYESEVMWKLTALENKYYEKVGIEVVPTRNNINEDVALVTRGKMSAGCGLFVSNHTNAATSEDVDRITIYYLVDDSTTDCDDRSKEIAKRLAPVISEVMGVKQIPKIVVRKAQSDRNGDGMLNDNYYGVLHGARLAGTPGILVEHSFHTCPTTVEWLLNDDNLDKLARAKVECIASWLLNKEANPHKLPTETLVYNPRTQFISREDVMWMQWELVQAGYEIAIDGRFTKTVLAVLKDYQLHNGLEADGKCGPLTREKMICD